MAREPAPIYLDYNATAPLLPAARERMLAALDALPGNPSSPHRYGQEARGVLESARGTVAGALGVARREVHFTGGGSEGNNQLLRWAAHRDGPAHVITTPIEHPSVLRCAEWLASHGVAVDYLPVDRDGRVVADAIPELLRPETCLVSVMAANNETGVLQPLAEVVQAVRAHSEPDAVIVHSDAVQAFGRMPLEPGGLGLDAVTVAAHKIGGPKGVGAVAVREGLQPPALVLGGAQERGRRAGTESVFLVEGFAGAVAWTMVHREAIAHRLAELRERLVSALARTDGFFENGAGAPRLANTVSLGFEGIAAQSLLVAMDLRQIAISSGSACSSGAIEPSHVLQAMGVPTARLESSLRISMGWGTTDAEVERCAEVLLEEVGRLRARRRRAAG